jgi:hypothetical protein
VTANDRAGMSDPGELAKTVDAVSKESGLFSWFTRDPDRGAAADYRVAISLSCGYLGEPGPDGSLKHAPGLGITAGTLCVIPCRDGHVECRLVGVVKNRSGKAEKSYQVNETIESNLYGCYAIPLGLSRDSRRVIENELRTLYRQMLDAHAFSAGAG